MSTQAVTRVLPFVIVMIRQCCTRIAHERTRAFLSCNFRRYLRRRSIAAGLPRNLERVVDVTDLFCRVDYGLILE
jgi:hypothetical protein